MNITQTREEMVDSLNAALANLEGVDYQSGITGDGNVRDAVQDAATAVNRALQALTDAHNGITRPAVNTRGLKIRVEVDGALAGNLIPTRVYIFKHADGMIEVSTNEWGDSHGFVFTVEDADELTRAIALVRSLGAELRPR